MATKGWTAEDITVEAVMNVNMPFCHPEDDVLAAIEIMRAQKVRQLPFADDSKSVQGFLSTRDAFAEARRPNKGS